MFRSPHTLHNGLNVALKLIHYDVYWQGWLVMNVQYRPYGHFINYFPKASMWSQTTYIVEQCGSNLRTWGSPS
jgi:hypothetical protein